MSTVKGRIDGVVIGVFLGFGENAPLVVFPGNVEETAVPARSLAALTSDMVGAQVALLFENGDPGKPLIVGRIVDTTAKREDVDVVRDGETIRITAQERLELRCGKSVIIMEKDGHLTIRGTYLVNHATAANRIRGGSVNIN